MSKAGDVASAAFGALPDVLNRAGVKLPQGANPQTARGLLIQVRNGQQLASAQGTAGKLAYNVLPEAIENTILSKMKDEFLAKFAEKGVMADVQIVQSQGYEQAMNPVWKPVAIGAIALLGIEALRLVMKKRK